MSPWFQPFTLADLNARRTGTLDAHLAIEFTAVGDDWLEGTLPVDGRTLQPRGVLHGGASLALAETLGSCAANLCVDRERYACVGQEISASHLRPVRAGLVTGRASPLHLGRRAQVWEIAIRNADGQLTCVARLTMAVVDAR